MVTALNTNRTRGSALIVCLVMLLVLTLISLSGINTAIMHEKMASNSQSKSKTFHAADSAVGLLSRTIVGGDLTALEQALAREDLSDETAFDISDSQVTSSYQARYLGEVALTSGTSMGADQSSTLLKGYRFELRGTSESTATGAFTRIFRGVEYL